MAIRKTLEVQTIGARLVAVDEASWTGVAESTLSNGDAVEGWVEAHPVEQRLDGSTSRKRQ